MPPQVILVIPLLPHFALSPLTFIVDLTLSSPRPPKFHPLSSPPSGSSPRYYHALPLCPLLSPPSQILCSHWLHPPWFLLLSVQLL